MGEIGISRLDLREGRGKRADRGLQSIYRIDRRADIATKPDLPIGHGLLRNSSGGQKARRCESGFAEIDSVPTVIPGRAPGFTSIAETGRAMTKETIRFG